MIATLRTLFSPYLPFSCEKLHRLLGEEQSVQSLGWQVVAPTPGRLLPAPAPLFKKLEPSIVAEEEARLGT